MLVTWERQATKFAMHYYYIIRNRSIKVAVIAFGSFLDPLNWTHFYDRLNNIFKRFFCLFFLFHFLIWFVMWSENHDGYENMTKAGQLPQERKRELLKKTKRLKQLCICSWSCSDMPDTRCCMAISAVVFWEFQRKNFGNNLYQIHFVESTD